MKFFNLIYTILLFVLTIGCCISTYEVKSRPLVKQTTEVQLIENLENSTILLFTYNSEQEIEGFCAGVWISPSTILTAKHCIQEDDTYHLIGSIVKFRTNFEYTQGINEDYFGMVAALSSNSDLALIKSVSSVSHNIAVLSNKIAHDGDLLHIVGHTNGFFFTYLPGTVSRVRNIVDKGYIQQYIQIYSGVWLGNSGGGAFDSHGNLVGIASFITTQAPNISFFVSTKEIGKFLKEENLF